MTDTIVVSDVTVTYRNGHTALHDASFSVPGGSIAALVGVNGSGKSTLFKALMGFVRLASGSISVLGMPTREALRQSLVAYVPQSEEVDWSFPVLVEDVVMMGRYGHMGLLRRPKPHDQQIVSDALARVDMLDYRHRQIGELSGGQKKGYFWRAPLPSRAALSCWMSRLPAWTFRLRPESSACWVSCAMKARRCWSQRIIWDRSRSSVITP